MATAIQYILLEKLSFDHYLPFYSEQINEWGVRIHIAGRLSLLPKDLQALVSKSMLATRDNNKLRLNIAYAYTGMILF